MAPALDDPAAAKPRPVTILLVEDVRINQDLVRYILEAAGHTVDVVCNGAEAIMAVQDTTYDIVFMDIQMPYLDGLEATRVIRKLQHACRQVPIVAMTANVLPDQIAVARAAGMVDIIHKPFSATQIHSIVARVVGTDMAPTTLLDEWIAPQPALPQPWGDCDIAVLARLGALIGDAKVKTLLAGLATSLADRFDADPATPEGRAAFKAQAHASVAGSGMLGFKAFAVACKTLETADEDATFPARAGALVAMAATVIAAARALATHERALETLAAAA